LPFSQGYLSEGDKSSERRPKAMRHKLRISVSKKPPDGGVVTCRTYDVRERFLRVLFGDKRRVTVLIPGDSVDEIAICEEGGKAHEQSHVS
jgi:hypothetical protein